MNYNIKRSKDINESSKINANKKITKKYNMNFNTERILNKMDIDKNPKNDITKKRINTKLILNQKKVEPKKIINNNAIKKNINQNNIKTNNSLKKKKEQIKKNTALFDDNL